MTTAQEITDKQQHAIENLTEDQVNKHAHSHDYTNARSFIIVFLFYL